MLQSHSHATAEAVGVSNFVFCGREGGGRGRGGERWGVVTRPSRGVTAGRATTCFPSRPPHKLTSNSSAPQWQQPVCVTIRARREGGHGGGKGRPRSSFSIAETLALILALGLSLCPFPTGWSKDAKTSMQKWCGLSGR